MLAPLGNIKEFPKKNQFSYIKKINFHLRLNNRKEKNVALQQVLNIPSSNPKIGLKKKKDSASI